MDKTHSYLEHEAVNGDHGDGIDCSVLPSRTLQSFAQDADINVIVERFGLTGELPENVPAVLQSDFEGVTDFQSAMNLLVAAREAFDAMPARVRNRFDNDPEKFTTFVSDDRNYEESVKLGLVRPDRAEAFAAKQKADREAAIKAAAEEMLRAAAAAKGTSST